MAVSNDRTIAYGQYRKGSRNGKASCYDQIAADFGKTGVKDCSTGFAAILRSSQPTRFYTGSDICGSRASSVLQDRLSRDYKNPGRKPEHQRYSGPEQTAALYHPAKGSAQDAKKNTFQGLLGAIFDHARACRWTKLTAVCENQSHLIASALISNGLSTDCHHLKPAVAQAVKHLAIDTLLADSGYDAEYNHQLCRREFGIRSTVIQVNDRNLKYGRTGGEHRRRMKQLFPAASYKRRWHIESVFSRFKRRLGNTLTARKDESRTSECLLRVLTYNLMIVLFTFQKSVTC
jgi:transposase